MALLKPGATAFLDRDGTINVSAAPGEYISSPEQLRILPGAADAIRSLNERGNPVVVVTNQRGISLGIMSHEDVYGVHERLRELLAVRDAHIDALFYCPHEIGTCGCRKPGSGMFLKAERQIPDVKLDGAAMIGDSDLDVEAGLALGLTTVKIAGRSDPPDSRVLSARTLEEAVSTLT